MALGELTRREFIAIAALAPSTLAGHSFDERLLLNSEFAFAHNGNVYMHLSSGRNLKLTKGNKVRWIPTPETGINMLVENGEWFKYFAPTDYPQRLGIDSKFDVEASPQSMYSHVNNYYAYPDGNLLHLKFEQGKKVMDLKGRIEQVWCPSSETLYALCNGRLLNINPQTKSMGIAVEPYGHLKGTDVSKNKVAYVGYNGPLKSRKVIGRDGGTCSIITKQGDKEEIVYIGRIRSPTSEYFFSHPAISPDEKKIAWLMSDQNYENWSIMTYSPGEKTRRTLLKGISGIEYLAWLSDNKKLVMQVKFPEDKESSIFTLDVYTRKQDNIPGHSIAPMRLSQYE